jgi:hypothetical protein
VGKCEEKKEKRGKTEKSEKLRMGSTSEKS